MAIQQQNQEFYYGQGKVKIAVINPDGTLDPWRWLMDVSDLSGSLTSDSITHDESSSGKKLQVVNKSIRQAMSLSMTLHAFTLDNLALGLVGVVTAMPAGTVTAETLPTVEIGDEVVLQHMGVTNVVISDSNSTPVTIPEENYEVDANFGNIRFIDLPGSITQPLQVAYSYAAQSQVSMFTKKQEYVALRYEGINIVENDAPILAEFYKVSTQAFDGLPLITNGTEVAGMTLNANPLADMSRPDDPVAGRFGRIVKLDEPIQ